MDSSRQSYTSLDELRQIELEARQSHSLDTLRVCFDRVQVLRRLHADDFDLQLFIAEVQEHIIERARQLRQEPASSLLSGNPGRLFADPEPPPVIPLEEPPEPPPGVERVDEKTWQRATYIGLFFTVILLAAFFYLIQTARRLNFPPVESSEQTIPPAPGSKAASTQKTSDTQTPVSTKPSVRLYTDLIPGTVSIDGNEPEDLKDGELQMDNLAPGRHSLRVVGRTGDSAFSFDFDEKAAPKIVGLPSANNAMSVLVSTQNGKARLVTNADQSLVSLDGKPAGQVGPDGLNLDDLGTSDHDLQVTEGKDRQRFVLTYTPAPALTVYVKSDPNAGTAVVVTGQDGADVYINDKLYRRKTDRGQIRIPLKVGDYVVRVHKAGFIDPPPQSIDVQKAEETRVEFHLQPVPEISTLQIKGALPGTMVYVDRDLAAAIGADGNANISNVKPGDHTIELRRDQALTKRFQRTFHTGEVVSLTGTDVTLDKVVPETKPAAPSATPAPPPTTPPPVTDNSMQVEGEQVRKGGGFLPYHATKVPGRYSFSAQIRKSGGFLKKGRLQWYAAYTDSDNYILYSLDGKHATVREVVDGKTAERKVPFTSDANEWIQVEMSVKQNSVDARVRTPSGPWSDLGPVTGPRDFTQGRVGFFVPGNDEIAVSNFRFAAH